MKSLTLFSLALLVACGNDKSSDSGEATPFSAPISCDDVGIDIPSGLGEASGAWDPAGRLVFFGGNDAVPIECAFGNTSFVGETWAYKPACEGFVRIETAESPQDRGRHVAVYDDVNHAMLIHGGRSRVEASGPYTLYGDTWSFDLSTDTWTKVTGAADGPSKRGNHGGAFARGKMYINGGNESTDGANFLLKNDTWAFDPTNNTWEKLSTTNKPANRLYHPMTSDGDHLYIYGGGDENALFGSGFMNDLWSLNLDTLAWTELSDGTEASAPVGRIWGSLTHDAANNRLVMFGGHDETPLGNNNELWQFNLENNKWKLLEAGDRLDNPENGFCDFPADYTTIVDGSPERREAGVSAQTGDGKLIIFGGKTDCGNINDVWSLDLSTDVWEEHSRATQGEACLRAYQECSSMCF
ncbi:MAG: hypothetical protein GWP91_24800 [Rhodobacterales bacterium]|nr:hypothetical protein [Rhodobacterales bacterium]